MRKISFYWIAAFLLAAFVVSMGGCGGGGSNNFSRDEESSGTETPEKTLSSLLVSSDMAGVMYGNEWRELINEFEASGSADKMNYHTWVYCITDEEAQKLREEYADDELRLGMLNELLFDADEISRDYAAEYNILLIYPNEDFINRTLKAAGLEGNYVMDDSGKRLEMYAIAKRTVNGRTFSFEYQAFKADDAVITSVRESDDIEVTSGDINYADSEVSGDVIYFYDENGNIVASADITSEKKESTVEEEEDGKLFFNINRWRSYYNWCASLTDLANESAVEASEIEFRAAANDDLTKISEAQNKTFDCDHYQSGYRPWGGAVGGDSVTINRKSQVTFRVYCCHSFKYNCDYYLVQATTTTSPRNYQDKMDHEFTWYQGGGKFGRYGYTDYVNYLSGYTGVFGLDCYISSISSKKENSNLSTNDVALTDYIPVNVPKSTTKTEGISWSMGGEIGFSGKSLAAKLSGGVTHSSSETWTTTEWKIVAHPFDKSKASAGWTADIEGPSNSWAWHEKVDFFAGGNKYMGISSTGASRDTLSFKSEWIWQVSNSVWSKQDEKTLPMRINFFWEEGFCFGEGKDMGKYISSYSWDGGRTYPRFDKNHIMKLDMPKHSWVEQKTFDISGNGDKSAGLGFNILSEGKWSVKSDQNWITFTRSSGNATGENQYPVRFQVAENNTGRPREAKITFTAQVGDRITETEEFYVNQAAK